MKSISFAQIVKLPALVATGVGLLLPVLPASAATSKINTVNPVNDSTVAESQKLLIAQQSGCPMAEVVDYNYSIETANYYASICIDGDGDLFYYGVDKDGNAINVYGVYSTDSGAYAATNDEGYTYMVYPDGLEVYDPYGDLIMSEPAY